VIRAVAWLCPRGPVIRAVVCPVRGELADFKAIKQGQEVEPVHVWPGEPATQFDNTFVHSRSRASMVLRCSPRGCPSLGGLPTGTFVRNPIRERARDKSRCRALSPVRSG
jgi:hypothetical protein